MLSTTVQTLSQWDLFAIWDNFGKAGLNAIPSWYTLFLTEFDCLGNGVSYFQIFLCQALPSYFRHAGYTCLDKLT